MWAHTVTQGDYILHLILYCLLTLIVQDVKTLTLSPNTTPVSDSKGDATDRPQFVCPLTLKEMNGSQPFVYISTCGCVFTQAGLKTVTASPSAKDKTDDAETTEETLDLCPQCGKKYSRTDHVVLLNPPQDEEDDIRMKMEQRRLLEPPKKSKKRKNASPDESEPPTKKQAGPHLNPSISGASRAVISSLAMEEAKRKVDMSDAVKSLYGDGTKRKETFMTMGTFTRVCKLSHPVYIC